MPRSRVLSFMSQWGGGPRSPVLGEPPSSPSAKPSTFDDNRLHKPPPIDVAASYQQSASGPGSPRSPSTPSRARGDSRIGGRPTSMMQTYQPPQVDVANDTPPELQPIFSYLNSHSNKLYQEGYFLKLHDLDTRGRPSPDRVWVECFAQLVGTVLSLWDAAALDAAGEDGEVVPTFINLSDASIKMIESLPMNGAQGGNLQNVLSVSTAANNRYLLHFNSLSSLTQWTAGIRLAMFEHATLQEAYTGSLIAGKGRFLNNIRAIMERSKFAHDDWARVRFGAGTPWKRCWCVISPPDEKEYAKAQKEQKKSSVYDRVKIPKGNIKFYDTRKITKKTRPIATISDAYAAYAIYPQSKPLIDQSTLVKLEGLVTIHTAPESTTEGFVFIMPEVHAAVSGFEMMLRFLFPVYDTFCLYGRPTRLIADSLDQRGLMFAMPRDRRYGYLDTLDVAGLIHTKGSPAWSERQWRREMKKLTGERMLTQQESSPRNSHQSSRLQVANTRGPVMHGGVRFNETAAPHSSPGSRSSTPPMTGPDGAQFAVPRRTDSAPPVNAANSSPHRRSVSDMQGYRRHMADPPSRLSEEAYRPEDDDIPPQPPQHGTRMYAPGPLERINSGAEVPSLNSNIGVAQSLPPPQPVVSPPALQHNPNSRPSNQPTVRPEVRRKHSNVDDDTLYQMQEAARRQAEAEGEWNGESNQHRRDMVDTNLPGNTHREVPTDTLQGLVIDTMGTSNASTQSNMNEIGVDSDNAPETYPLLPRHATPPTREGFPFAADDSRDPSDHILPRKPVARDLPELAVSQPTHADPPTLPSPTSPILDDDWEGGVVDVAALDRILDIDSRNNTMDSTGSTTTPDYASTISSYREATEPVEKPRAGKLKMTGDPEYKSSNLAPGGAGRLDTYAADNAPQSQDLPIIDFGPTYAYKPTVRPGTGGTITPGSAKEVRERSTSRDRLRSSSKDRLSAYDGLKSSSPGETSRNSYFGGRHTPSPTAGIETPNNRASIAWQPSSVSPGARHSRGPSLTPEQWVQQRAALASQPQQPPPRKPVGSAPHNRQASTSNLTEANARSTAARTPPPFPRNSSADWSQGQTTPPSRPHSRNPSIHLDQFSGAATSNSTNLTAHEQMQIARATGAPMLNYTTGAQRKEQEQYAPGLFGALAAREKDREQSKSHNRSSVAVQQAIATRQQQQQQQQAAEFQRAAMRQAQYQMQVNQQVTQQQMQQVQHQQMLIQQQQRQAQSQTFMQQNQMYDRAQSPSVYRSAADAQSIAPSASAFSGVQPMQWERQQALMAQQPGGAQQWQQQQGRR